MRANRIENLDFHARRLLDQRREIGRDLLVVVDLAGDQRVHAVVGRRLEPLDAVDLGDLAAGRAGRRLVARHVVRVLHVDDVVAGQPFLA